MGVHYGCYKNVYNLFIHAFVLTNARESQFCASKRKIDFRDKCLFWLDFCVTLL